MSMSLLNNSMCVSYLYIQVIILYIQESTSQQPDRAKEIKKRCVILILNSQVIDLVYTT